MNRALVVVAGIAFVSGLSGCTNRSEDARQGSKAVDTSSPSKVAAPSAPDVALAAKQNAMLASTPIPLHAGPASHATPITCPAVALQATAMASTNGLDSTTAASAVSFAVPAALTVVAGSATNFTAFLDYGPSNSQSTETECKYVPSGATQLHLVSCYARTHHNQSRPGAGSTVTGTYFELRVIGSDDQGNDDNQGDDDDQGDEGSHSHATVTVRVTLGSVTSSDTTACTQNACGTHGGIVHTQLPVGSTRPHRSVTRRARVSRAVRSP